MAGMKLKDIVEGPEWENEAMAEYLKLLTIEDIIDDLTFNEELLGRGVQVKRIGPWIFGRRYNGRDDR